jgi:hypothetical protein
MTASQQMGCERRIGSTRKSMNPVVLAGHAIGAPVARLCDANFGTSPGGRPGLTGPAVEIQPRQGLTSGPHPLFEQLGSR